MNERAEQMKQLRQQGMSYEEIGKVMGISKQRVYQVIGGTVKNWFKEITPEVCIYPNLRKWLNENRVNRSELTRMVYGNTSARNKQLIYSILKGSDCLKHHIDNILQVTGLTYEEAFGKEGAEE